MLIYQQVEQISLTRVVNCKCFPKTDSKFKMIWNSNILHNSYCLLISSYVFGLNRNSEKYLYYFALKLFYSRVKREFIRKYKTLYWDIISDFYTSTCSFRYMIEFTELSSTHVQYNSWPGKLAQHS